MLKIFLTFLIVPFFLVVHPTFKGKVIGISDGDTITVLVENKPVKVRLQGIDCPESHQDFGQRAKQFTSDLCYAKEVTVEDFGTDRYGRTLGEVLLPDGKSLNKTIVEEGYGWHYKKYSSDTVLANLEIKARALKKGLWIDSNPIAPWEFRRNNSNK